MQRVLLMLCLALLAGQAWASGSSSDKEAVYASLEINGSITVSGKGQVTDFKIDKADKLPPFVVKMLDQDIPKWQFFPNLQNGHPYVVKTPMAIRLVAKPVSSDKYAISLDQVTFGNGYSKDGHQVQYKKGKDIDPNYPHGALMAETGATVYVVMQINREGRVAKAAVAEVDLEKSGPHYLMVRWRSAFAHSALSAARRWQFQIPTKGIFALQDHWVVVTSIDYWVTNFVRPKHTYGKWRPYIPGPYHAVKWARDQDLFNHSRPPVGGGLHMQGSGLRPKPQEKK